MATATLSTPEVTPADISAKPRTVLGPALHGLAMDYETFIEADHSEGYLYELARGVVVVTEVPGIHHGRIVLRCSRLFGRYDEAHPGIINYQAGGGRVPPPPARHEVGSTPRPGDLPPPQPGGAAPLDPLGPGDRRGGRQR